MQFTVEVKWNWDWSDESAYVLDLRIETGFAGPDEYVARVGRCSVLLDNSSKRFSPLYGGPLFGSLLPRKRVRVVASDGVSTWYLFVGYIESITPDGGEYSARQCRIECVDALAILAKQAIGVVYDDEKSVYDAVGDVVAVAYTPATTDYSDNGDVLMHYGRTWLPEQTTTLEALTQICRAVYGRFWIARDGTPTYQSRDERQDASMAFAMTLLGEEVLDRVDVNLSIGRVINRVQVVTYPVETIAAVQVIWKAQTILRLAPGETRVIYALFHDSNGERCGAVNVIDPVATTDYTVNEMRDGSGFDYTSDPAFSIATETEATRMKITLGNSAIGALYVTLLQVRGKPIVTYDPIVTELEDSTSQAAYQVRALALDLPMQADPVFGQAYAEYLISRYRSPALVADRIGVKNELVLNTVNVFSLELMDTMRLTEPQTGFAGVLHRIRGLDYALTPTGFEVGLRLERADDLTYWLLGVTNFGELNIKTRLGL